MKALRILGWTLLGFFALLNVLIAFHAYRFTYFYDNPVQQPTRKAEDYSTAEKIQYAIFGFKALKKPISETPAYAFENVTIPTEDGEQLAGWWLPVASQPKGTVVCWHGHANNRSGIVSEINFFREQGYNVLACDFRAHGASSGNVCTVGYNETADVKAAYDWVAGRGERNVVLWGVSMGAATLLKAIPEYDLRPARVILECPFGTFRQAIDGRLRTMGLPTFPITDLLMFWGSLERTFWAFDYEPAESAESLMMPTLLNWGAQDARVTRPETDAIYQNLASTKKQLVVFEQSGHESFCRKEPAKWQTAVGGLLNVATPKAPVAMLEP